ncbi:MAG: hypothetical protein HY654_00545, partial [Acidobacteria bacterium]|nr:hypothetical protein [Acidobacteriota bacterium]
MKKVAVALACCAVVAIIWVLGPIWLGGNFHPVIPNRVYRSGEMRAAALERAIDRHGLRSIVNLRGREEGRGWYEDERRIAQARGLVRYDLDFSERLLPPRPAVVELI